MQKNSYILCLFILICLAIVFFAWKSYEDYYNFSPLYEQGRYSDILEHFGHVKSPEMLHNLGNAAFSEFLNSQDSRDLSILESAVSYYSGSLDILEHDDTRYNYNLSKDMLDSFSQQQQGGGQQGENQGSENSSQNQQEESDPSEQESENQENESQTSSNPISNSRQEEYLLSQEEEIEKLTDEEKKELEQATERLKQEQIYNQNFYGKKEQKSDFQSIFENFFGSIDRGGEKDW